MALFQSQSQNNFYVYEHIRLDTNKTFYVGKGRNDRATRFSNRSLHWKRIAKKAGYSIKYLLTNLPEELALLAEQERIDQLKRLGYELCNKTDGGDGLSGMVFTDEHKRKLSESNKGKKRSPEVSAKMSLIKGKKVFCITDNLFFNSTFAAAKYYKCDVTCIRRACNGTRKTASRKKMRYATAKDIECYQHTQT